MVLRALQGTNEIVYPIVGNLRGTFVCMKHELAQMVRQDSGLIVNTSSGAGVRP